MTTEEKARAYDEVLNKLRHFIAKGVDPLITRADAQDFFPELKESDGDKELSKILGRVIRRYINDPNIPYTEREKVSMEIIPYVERLEKQSEHTNFLNKIQIGDKVTRNEDGVLVNLSQLKRVAKKDEKQDEQKSYASETMNEKWDFDSGFTRMMEKEQKHAAWSEDDENNINSIVSRLEVDISYWESRSKTRTNEDKKLIEWLKFLKDRYTWKPSDEQMKALRLLNLISGISYAGQKQELIDLYNDLKKLKGE